LYVKDISDEMPDSEIWETALKNNYTILTRDKDFYYRAIQSKISPKIVLFRLGNYRSRVLFEYFVANLAIIEQHFIRNKLIVLWENEIQVVV
jgi:predicted nuclease of predicted toxin-antitoxin system